MKRLITTAWACLLGTGLSLAPALASDDEHGAQEHIRYGMHSEEEAAIEALWYASAEGDVALLRRIMRTENIANADETAVGQFTTPLWIAAQQGHAEIVNMLIVAGADVDAPDGADHRTPLFQAAQNGHIEVVEALVEHGASLEAPSASSGATPLFIAAARGHTAIVRLLLAAGARVDVTASAAGREDTPLGIATERGHHDVVALLEASDAAERMTNP